MTAFKAVLADEQVLFIEGIKRMLAEMDNPEVEVIAAASTGKDLLEIIEMNEIDLIIFELNFLDMDYDELIKKIRSINPEVKLFILSAYGNIKLVRSCFNKGIDGFALKSNSLENFKKGIIEVMQDKIFMGDGLHVAPQINKEESTIPRDKTMINDRFMLKQKLTNRELQILKMVIDGMNNRQISKELYISHETVGVHKKNIKKKLNVNSTPQLIDFVKENKIVD
jgi:DNA-binding NarL/FixJ family response regulator